MFEGAKGGSSKFKQTPDNLRSTDTFEGVLGLCAGPIVGPVRGLKSIKIDGTPIENETGELNFPDFAGVYADGDPLKFPQEVKLQLGAGASPLPVNVALRNDGGSNPVWVSRTLPNTGADFIDMRFIVNALYTQTKKGIFETNATIEIQMKPVGSTNWINPTISTPNANYLEQGQEGFDRVKYLIARWNYREDGQWSNTNTNYNITGKTTGPAVYEARIAVPNEGAYANTAWDVRARLLQRESYSDSDGTNQEKRTVSWESMSAVYSTKYGTHEDWRGLAWLQVTGKASDQLTGVPEITGVYQTKIVQVPPIAIFNPATRAYQPGVWDGSWSQAFTNDPAWVINNAISDAISGLSLIAPGSYLNKWDALEVSKWCSQPVSDGDGGLEPRYSLNLAISDPQNAEEFIRYMAGAVGALAWDNGLGEWRIKIDKPETAVDIFTLDSIDGEFVYSHTDVDTRYNDIIGQFKNKEKDYEMDAVRLFDNPSIANLGRKPTTIPLIGCTGRQEAMRRVKLRLRACANERRIVNFTTNRRGRNIDPLAPILIADGDLDDSSIRSQARIVGISADRKTITVRDAMRLEAGVDYEIQLTSRNPDYAPDTATQPANSSFTSPTLVINRTVTNTSAQRGSVKTIYLSSPLPTTIDANADFSLVATGLPSLPRMYRVISVVPQDDGERVAISAINVDVDKWDAADNVSKDDTVFVDLRGAVPPPTALSGRPLLQLVEIPLEQGTQVNLQAVWVRPPSAFINGFDVRYRINGGAWQPSVRQPSAEWELVGPTVGTYEVEVRTVGRTGELSLPLVGVVDIDQQVLGAGDITYDGGETLEELKPAEAGATEGMTDAEKSDAAQLAAAVALAQQKLSEIEGSIDGDFTQLHQEVDVLNNSVATVQGNIASLQGTTSTIQQSVGTLQQDVTAAQGTINSISIDLAAAQGSISSLQSFADSAGSSLTTLNNSVSALQGQANSIQQSVNNVASDLGSAVGRITAAEGEVDQLQSLTATQGSLISQNATAISNVAGSLSAFQTRVSAGKNNLLEFGSFELGAVGWPERGPNWSFYFNRDWGPIAILSQPSNGTHALASAPFGVSPGNAYTISADTVMFADSGAVYVDMVYKDAAGNNVLDGPQTPRSDYHDFSNDFDAPGRVAVTSVAPPNAVTAVARFVGQSLVNCVHIGVRQIKVESGNQWSRYSDEATIVNRAVALQTADGQISSLTTRIGTAEASITTTATAVTNAQGSISTLEQTVSSQGGSITSLQSSVSDINGTVSTLSQTVSSQGGSITSLQTAVSTAEGNLSSLTTRVDAGSKPNLIVNGDFANGLNNWVYTHNGWYSTLSGSWGQVAGNYSLGTLGGQARTYLETEDIQVYAGVNHTVSFETSCNVSDPAAYTYGEIVYWDAANNVVGQFTGPTRAAGGDFTPDNSARKAQTFTSLSPAGSVRARVRVVMNRMNGNIVYFHIRQVKLESGASATPFNSAASVVQQWKSFNDLNSSFASLSTTVSSQGGSITSLQSSYTGLSGTVSTLSSTVSSQGSTISSLQSTTSTLQGDTATLKTQVSAGAGNLAPNTDFAINASGWVPYHNGVGAYNHGRDLIGDGWRPPAEHVWVMAQEDNTAGYYASFYTDQVIPVDASKFYEWSGYLGPHRCTGNILVQFFDVNGTHFDQRYGSYHGPMNYNGHDISSYARTVLKTKPPAGSVSARIIFEKGATQEGSNSYLVVCRPQMKEVFETAASPAAYSVGNAGAVISQQASVLSTLGSSFSSLETRVSSAEGSVSQLQSSMTSANGSISSLQSSVSSLNGSVSTLQQSSSTQAGQISSLQNTVSTQGGQISTNSQAITTINGTLSQLNTIVTASSSPNLVPNGGFENGLRGWQFAGPGNNSWVRQVWVWGSWAQNNGFTGGGGFNHAYLESELFGIAGGGNTYTLSFDYDMQGGGGCAAYGELVWFNNSGQYIGQSSGPLGGPKSFDTTGNSRYKTTLSAPADAGTMRARVTFYAPDGATTGGLNVRQIKVDFGSVATPYSGEATAGQMYTAYSDLNSSHASLSSTVSSQGGSISSLQSTTSTLNGTVSSLSNTVSAQGTSISNLQSVQATQGGTISTLLQRVTVGGNLLQNTEFAVGAEGWGFYSHDSGNTSGFVWGRDGAGDDWRPEGEHNLFINQQDNVNWRAAEWYSSHVSVIGGRWYEASVYAATHRCYCDLKIEWYDYAGNSVGVSNGPRSDSYPGFYQSNGGNQIGNYQRIWVKAQAPANAARALLNWVKHGTSQDGAWNGATDSWGWMVRPQIAEVYSDTNSPTAYFPGRTSASFTLQQTSINSLNGQYSSLSQTVATQGSSISSQATSISNLEGTQASLSQTVQSQGSSISTLQTATSNLQGDTATLRTQVTSGNPNLLRNGGFELGNLDYWSSHNASFSTYGGTDTWGTHAVNGNNVPDNSWTYIESNPVNIERDWYTLTCDVGYFLSGTGHTYLELIWINSSGGYLATSGGPAISPGRNFSSDGSTRRDMKVTAFAPEGAAKVQARIIWYKGSGTAQSMHVRQVKLERGQNATPYTAEASARQSFEMVNTLNGQYASLNSTVSTLNSTVNVQQTAINNLNGKTAAYWQVEAVAGGRAQLKVYADANGGAGVDIIGDLRVSGNGIFAGTINPEALDLSRFVKRISGTGGGAPTAGQELLLYAQDIGVTSANGSYVVELTGSMTTTVGGQTSTHSGKPFYLNHIPDGGFRVRLYKNGALIHETYLKASELITSTNVGSKTVSLSRNLVVDAPGGGDASSGMASIQLHAIRGNSDTGIVNQGDYYQQDVSASYANFSIAAKTKWTFI